MATKPERVELTPLEVLIRWDNGHASHYSNKYLRSQCPCASCVVEWTKRRVLDPATIPADIQALDYMEVGRYALSFLWSDGHDSGIYPYVLLEDLCQCQACLQSPASGKG
ncbi:MAG: DUF971 domain-containing protein [Chloroflexi bacterium]|nr:DUF971 domain-containing protein [Chloroflexota bacterium]